MNKKKIFTIMQGRKPQKDFAPAEKEPSLMHVIVRDGKRQVILTEEGAELLRKISDEIIRDMNRRLCQYDVHSFEEVEPDRVRAIISLRKIPF